MSMTFPIPFHALPLLALDTETTGVDNFNDRIVTCAMVYDDGQGNPQVTRNWIIDPGIEIPTGASDIHGVTTEIARAQGVEPTYGLLSIRDSLIPMLKADVPLVVYNASFDLTLLLAEFERFNIDFPYEFKYVIDPLVIDKAVDKWRKGSRKLTDMAKHYGFDLTNAHTADADCVASIAVTRAFGTHFGAPDTIEAMMIKQPIWKREQASSLQRHFRQSGKDPDAVINGDWPVEKRAA